MKYKKDKLEQEIHNIAYRIQIRNEIISNRRNANSKEFSKEDKELLMLSYEDLINLRDKIRKYNSSNKDYFIKLESALNDEISCLEKLVKN